MNSPLQIVIDFATSLDREDYPTTFSLLTEDCAYDSPTGRLTGPDAIIASYRGHGDSARERFDSIKYSHRVTTLEEGWTLIEFIDEICVGKKTHVFRCSQRVHLYHDLIDRIVHVEIPGQRELLNAFLQTLK